MDECLCDLWFQLIRLLLHSYRHFGERRVFGRSSSTPTMANSGKSLRDLKHQLIRHKFTFSLCTMYTPAFFRYLLSFYNTALLTVLSKEHCEEGTKEREPSLHSSWKNSLRHGLDNV
ncbi:hypothetical protein QC760_000821 [Botrytis cinerea]